MLANKNCGGSVMKKIDSRMAAVIIPILLLGFMPVRSTLAQEEDYPDYLGDESIELLHDIDEVNDNFDIVGELIVFGTVHGLATSTPTETAATGSYDIGSQVDSIASIPAVQRELVTSMITNHLLIQDRDLSRWEKEYWNTYMDLLSRPGVGRVSGRSYGDPHLVTYDGARYSFQTVGEFVVSRSTNGGFEIQSRQTPISSSLSLNTAVAMNVFGIRIGVYLNTSGSNKGATTIKVDGMAIPSGTSEMVLKNGGHLSVNGNKIFVSWPSGEKALINIYPLGEYQYLEVFPSVYTNSAWKYAGLLGNANKRVGDDLVGKGNKLINVESGYESINSILGSSKLSPAMAAGKKLYLKKLSSDFASRWRVKQSESLFDYDAGFSSDSYTDNDFPLEHLILSDLSTEKIQKAQTVCQEKGVPAGVMEGCVYDVAFSGYAGFARSASQVIAAMELVEELGYELPVSSSQIKNVQEDAKKEAVDQIKDLMRDKFKLPF